MAKRRKLEAPSADDLSRIEAEFRRETGVGRSPISAPIAQVAADAAEGHDPRPPEARAQAARDSRDAARLREVEDRGLVIAELPLDEIDAEALVRDRVALDPDEMRELQASIAANGLRLPIEVFALPAGQGGYRYGLLSGYRRLRAVQALRGTHGDAQFGTIRALLRDPADMGGTFAAMIEENEVRADLSQFERGRIAVIASQQGAFATVEAAVDALFPVASKAKRSKIRSFAVIFEELGDMLSFPDHIKEKPGLALATALRGGAGERLRDLLARQVPQTPEEEAALLAEGLVSAGPAVAPAQRSRGGRPRKEAGRVGREVQLATGVTLQSQSDARGWAIRFSGPGVDEALVEQALAGLEKLLAERAGE